MARLLFLVEGFTEAQFIREILEPHLIKFSLNVPKPKIIETRENPGGRAYKGGNVTLSAATAQVKSLLHSGDFVTTFFDFYGCKWRKSGESVEQLEKRFSSEVGESRSFIPYIQQYEFEGLLFSNPRLIADVLRKPYLAQEFEKDVQKFNTPEQINGNYDTCPSRRIERLSENIYDKTLHATQIIEAIGLDRIREKCPRFIGLPRINDLLQRLD